VLFYHLFFLTRYIYSPWDLSGTLRVTLSLSSIIFRRFLKSLKATSEVLRKVTVSPNLSRESACACHRRWHAQASTDRLCTFFAEGDARRSLGERRVSLAEGEQVIQVPSATQENRCASLRLLRLRRRRGEREIPSIWFVYQRYKKRAFASLV